MKAYIKYRKKFIATYIYISMITHALKRIDQKNEKKMYILPRRGNQPRRGCNCCRAAAKPRRGVGDAAERLVIIIIITKHCDVYFILKMIIGFLILSFKTSLDFFNSLINLKTVIYIVICYFSFFNYRFGVCMYNVHK